MEKKERIRMAVDYLLNNRIVVNQLEIAYKMTANSRNVSAAINGHEKYLTDRFMQRFARTFSEISVDWLIHEKGAMLVKDNTVESIGKLEVGNTVPQQVPDLFGNEHDMLIRLETEREAMRKVIRNVNDPQTALSLLADILTANLK